MSIYLSNSFQNTPVKDLPEEMRNEIMSAVEESLNHQVKTFGTMDSDSYQKAWDEVYNSRVCGLPDNIEVQLVDEELSFYVVDNLRSRQDGMGQWKLDRFDKLEDAVATFAAYPKENTSALGARLTGAKVGPYGVGELDLVHRKNGEAVQVNDFKFSERWDNPLVRRAVDHLNFKLGISRESDCRMFNKSVLVPVQPWEPQSLNSYFIDKYLRPVEGAEGEVARRYGDPAMYGPEHPMHSEHLLSSINEVHVFGEGWIKGELFFKRLNSINEYDSPERLKVDSLNINYVDLNGRTGQADISPSQFALLKQQTIERTAQHPGIDEQIEAANKVRMEQQEKKSKDKSKDKDKGRDADDR